jgi:hypothetical protein
LHGETDERRNVGRRSSDDVKTRLHNVEATLDEQGKQLRKVVTWMEGDYTVDGKEVPGVLSRLSTFSSETKGVKRTLYWILGAVVAGVVADWIRYLIPIPVSPHGP